MLLAGCGGGLPGVASIATTTPAPGTSPAANTRTHELLLAGRCLRQHGLAGLPDPFIAASGPAKGQAILSKQALHGFSDSVVSSAMAACQAVLTRAGVDGGSSASRSPQDMQHLLAFARCVRRHGFTNFPDPDSQGQLNLAGTGINPHALTPVELDVARTCLPIAHGLVSIPTQGSATTSAGG
jgi:hypothetical protein